MSAASAFVCLDVIHLPKGCRHRACLCVVDVCLLVCADGRVACSLFVHGWSFAAMNHRWEHPNTHVRTYLLPPTRTPPPPPQTDLALHKHIRLAVPSPSLNGSSNLWQGPEMCWMSFRVAGLTDGFLCYVMCCWASPFETRFPTRQIWNEIFFDNKPDSRMGFSWMQLQQLAKLRSSDKAKVFFFFLRLCDRNVR